MTYPLILNLNGGQWLPSHPDRVSPGKEPRYPLNKRLAGFQSRFGRFGEAKKPLPLPDANRGPSSL